MSVHLQTKTAVTAVPPSPSSASQLSPPLPCPRRKGILKKPTWTTESGSEFRAETAYRERSHSLLDLSQLTSILAETERKGAGEMKEISHSYPGAPCPLDLIQLTSVEKKGKKKRGVRFPPNVLLQQAIIEGDLKEMERLIDEFGSKIVNEREPCGLTPAMRCVFENQLGALAILADAGAEFAACDGENWTVLHVASTMDDVEAAKFILAHGQLCLTQAKNVDGERAIDLAESSDMSRLLLDAETAHRDMKPASTSGRDELAILKHVQDHFQRKGSTNELNRVMQTSTNHDTLLHLAAVRNYTKLAAYLLTHGLCQLEYRDRRGLTALDTAALHNNSQVVRLLVACGASAAATLRTSGKNFHAEQI